MSEGTRSSPAEEQLSNVQCCRLLPIIVQHKPPNRAWNASARSCVQRHKRDQEQAEHVSTRHKHTSKRSCCWSGTTQLHTIFNRRSHVCMDSFLRKSCTNIRLVRSRFRELGKDTWTHVRRIALQEPSLIIHPPQPTQRDLSGNM